MSHLGPGEQHFESTIFFDQIEDKKDDEEYKNLMNYVESRMKKQEQENSPRLLKSHLPAHLLPKDIWTVKPKLIYVCRNAKDVAISMYHMYHSLKFVQYQGSMEDYFDHFLKDSVIYAPFHAHVNGFRKLQHHLDHILFISYDEMICDSFHGIKKISEFLGYNYTDDQLTELSQNVSFNNMNDSSKYKSSFLLSNMK